MITKMIQLSLSASFVDQYMKCDIKESKDGQQFKYPFKGRSRLTILRN